MKPNEYWCVAMSTLRNYGWEEIEKGENQI
jgi:hypothetical protein